VSILAVIDLSIELKIIVKGDACCIVAHHVRRHSQPLEIVDIAPVVDEHYGGALGCSENSEISGS